MAELARPIYRKRVTVAPPPSSTPPDIDKTDNYLDTGRRWLYVAPMNARTLDAAAAAHSVLVNTHRSPHEPRPAVPRLTLVACVASKQPGTHRAADLYTSPWFRKARAYVEQRGNPWLILSAEHGLLYPWQWVDSYDRTLTGQRAATRRSWAARVRGLFVSEYGSGSVGTLELLAGVTYRQYLAPELAPFVGEIAVPMAGLGIGSQLQWLTRAVEAGA